MTSIDIPKILQLAPSPAYSIDCVDAARRLRLLVVGGALRRLAGAVTHRN